MAALQKFKLFATPCGLGQSPTQSPRRSPVVEFRRHKTTLRSLLSLNRTSRRQEEVVMADKNPMRRHKLKDLFVSSAGGDEDESSEMLVSVSVGIPHCSKPPWARFRCPSLLKRKHWRPLLLTIPE